MHGSYTYRYTCQGFFQKNVQGGAKMSKYIKQTKKGTLFIVFNLFSILDINDRTFLRIVVSPNFFHLVLTSTIPKLYVS